MESAEIIGSINQIYDRFEIPPNIRLHMYRVTAVNQIVCDNWKGPNVNRDDIIATGLVHDLGNIAKMKFDATGLKIMGDEAKNVEHWKRIKERVITRYGNTDQEATDKMLAELGANERVRYLTKNMFYVLHNEKMLNSDDFELKICEYGDDRVGPFGIISVRERIDDLNIRYKGAKELEDLEINMPKLEEQIAANMSIRPDQIKGKSVKPYIEKYQNL